MAGKLTLSAVDQSPVREGGTATDALRETIALVGMYPPCRGEKKSPG